MGILRRKPSPTSVMSVSSGWITTKLLRRMNTRISRRNWSRSSIQSSRSCMQEELEGLQVVLVVCQEEPLEDLHPPVVELDLPLRKWTNIHLPKRQPSPVDDFLSISRLCVVLTVVTAIFCNKYFHIAIK